MAKQLLSIFILLFMMPWTCLPNSWSQELERRDDLFSSEALALSAEQFRTPSLINAVESAIFNRWAASQRNNGHMESYSAVGKGNALEHISTIVLEPIGSYKIILDEAIDIVKNLYNHPPNSASAVDKVFLKQFYYRLVRLAQCRSIGLFDAIVNSQDDYLLLFPRMTNSKMGEIGICRAFIETASPKELAEALIHEVYALCKPERLSILKGEKSDAEHIRRYTGVQRRLFGKNNPLKNIFRTIIDDNAPSEQSQENTIVEEQTINFIQVAIQRIRDRFSDEITSKAIQHIIENNLISDDFFLYLADALDIYGARKAIRGLGKPMPLHVLKGIVAEIATALDLRRHYRLVSFGFILYDQIETDAVVQDLTDLTYYMVEITQNPEKEKYMSDLEKWRRFQKEIPSLHPYSRSILLGQLPKKDRQPFRKQLWEDGRIQILQTICPAVLMRWDRPKMQVYEPTSVTGWVTPSGEWLTGEIISPYVAEEIQQLTNSLEQKSRELGIHHRIELVPFQPFVVTPNISPLYSVSVNRPQAHPTTKTAM